MIVKKKKMLKQNQHHQITFSICSSDCYNKYISQTKLKVNDLRVKSPTKTNIDHHNSDLK